KELSDTLGFREDEIIFTSGKSGIGIEDLFQAIVDRIPAPSGDPSANVPPKALVFDSQFDTHLGVVAFVRVVQGRFKRQQLRMLASKSQFMPLEVGYNGSGYEPQAELVAGEVG